MVSTNPNAFGADDVDALTYDFNPWGVSAKGTIEEPTDAQVKAFRALFLEIGGPIVELVTGKMTAAKKAEFIKNNSAELQEAKYDELFAGLADLCSQSPSTEQILALPYRPKAKFLGWMVGIFLAPKALTPATKR